MAWARALVYKPWGQERKGGEPQESNWVLHHLHVAWDFAGAQSDPSHPLASSLHPSTKGHNRTERGRDIRGGGEATRDHLVQSLHELRWSEGKETDYKEHLPDSQDKTANITR